MPLLTLSATGSTTTNVFTIGDFKLYENIKQEEAICYGKLAHSEMIQQRAEQEEPEKYLNDEEAFMDAADCLGYYDQKHVNVAIWWQDESVTIHCKMPNDIHEMFVRLDAELDCPVAAKAIRVQPCLLNEYHEYSCMHTFTIWLNEGPEFSPFKDFEVQWKDPRSFFLKFADKWLHFNPEAQQEVNQ